MSSPTYPLKEILDVKRRREEEAEKLVRDKKSALEKEEEKLKVIENSRDVVLQHYQDKLTQLRQILDEGTNTTTIRQTKDYIKIVKEKLEKEQVKVKEQKKKVENAEKELENARKVLRERQKDVEKILMHEKEWRKEVRKEEIKQEEKATDEMGTTIFFKNKKKE